MNLALFDFDGTITTKETFVDFVHFAVDRRRVLLGTMALSPLIAGYRVGIVPVRTIRAGIALVAFSGRNGAELRSAGADFAARVIPALVRPAVQQRIDWHKGQGDTVVVVSAALDVYLAPWAASHGLEVICSRLEEIAGTMTGRYEGGDCCGPEKRRRILEKYDVGRHPVVYAYGDTREDDEMLGLAHRRYFNGEEVTDVAARGSR